MSYKKYIADATIVNAQDVWNDRKYLIGLWQGSGCLMDLFIVCAPDEEDALDILVGYFRENNINRFFVDTDDMTGKEIADWEDSGGIIWVDGSYIYGENLSIEEL